ncbi:hypothetical protein VDG1235_4525 [Verrucomicrobiia bacterium DG1235]|nr:hypothetical protein VDG1235_4525 [Verrucomicrobiae bacterium DG1235]
MKSSGIRFTEYDRFFHELVSITDLGDGWQRYETILDREQEFELVWRVYAGSVTSSQEVIEGYLDSVSVNKKPLIQTQPQFASAFEEEKATLRVDTYNAVGKVSYQWRKNGDDISEATSAEFELSQLADSDYGDVYDVVISNEYGATVSDSVEIRNLRELATVIYPDVRDLKFEYFTMEELADEAKGIRFSSSGTHATQAKMSLVAEGPLVVRFRTEETGNWIPLLTISNLDTGEMEESIRSATTRIEESGSFLLEWKVELDDPYWGGGLDGSIPYQGYVEAGLVHQAIYSIELNGELEAGAEDVDVVHWSDDDIILSPDVPLEGELTYQWYRSNTWYVPFERLEGATSSSLTLSQEGRMRTGSFRLYVTRDGKRFESRNYNLIAATDDSDSDSIGDILELGLGVDPFSEDVPIELRVVWYELPVYSGGIPETRLVPYWWSNYRPWNESGSCDCDVILEGSYDLANWIPLEDYSLHGLEELAERDRVGFRDSNAELDSLIPFARFRLKKQD